jgi:hypothetical protein
VGLNECDAHRFSAKHGTVVDEVMKMMHQYSADLELRTQALADAQRRADHLLNQVCDYIYHTTVWSTGR